MKRIFVLLTGIMMAVSVTACTPTTEKTKESREHRTEMPAGAETQTTVDGAAEKVPDANAKPSVTVCVYSVKKDRSGLKQNMEAIDGEKLDAQLLINKMAELEIIEEGIKVQSFEQKKDVLTLDLSALKNSDDKLILTAIANTFLQNYDEDEGKLRLSVNGKMVSEDNLTYNKEYKTMGK